MDLLTQLIPPILRADRKVFRRARLILKIDLIIFLFSLLLMPFYVAIGFTDGVWIMAFAIVCTLIFPILLNISKNLGLSGHFFVLASITIFFSLVCFTGGVYSPYLVWLLSIPPITILYMRSFMAYLWLGFLSLSTLLIFGLEIAGYPFPNYQPLTWFPLTLLFSLTMVSIICTSVVRLFLSGYKNFSRKLKNSNIELQQSNQELERFAYIASHDLKSPLRNIVSFVNLIERRYGQKFDQNGNEYLEIVKNNALQMHHLIEDILEYSQSNNKELLKEKVDLVEMFLEITTQLQSIETYVPSEVLFDKIPALHADPATMNQLFQNLIENGLKYNDKKLRKVLIKFEHKKNKLHFKIIDNGIGIELDYQDSIFEMFKRLHNQSIYQGTGIGLAICKKIVQRYHGQISVSSEIGKGSVFHIRFPDSMLVQEAVMEDELIDLI